MMSLRRFKHDMIRGLGSCYCNLQSEKDIDKYKEIIQYGFLNPISFDQQIEGTRSNYLYELMKFFSDDYFFLESIILKLHKKNINENLFIHLVEHLVPFSEDGYIEATEELYRQYDKLINKKKFTKSDGKKLDRLCVCLVRIDGMRFIRNHISKIKKYTNKIKSADLSWLHYRIVRKYKQKGITLIKQVYSDFSTDPIYPTKPKDYKYISLIHSLGDKDHPRKMNLFSMKAEDSDKKKAIDYMIDNPNIEHKKSLLHILGIYEVLQYRVDDIINMIGKYDSEVNELIYYYCTELKDNKSRTLGYSLLENVYYRALGLQMIIQNYSDKDRDIIVRYTKKVKVDYKETEDWFNLFSKLIELLDNKKKNLPEELLLHIYNESLTSFKRELAFDIMKKRGMLTKKLLSEAIHDSDYDISKKAKRLFKKFE